MSFCKDCIILGMRDYANLAKIGGVDCYVATPSIDYLTEKLMADDFAENGFKTVIPDNFDGDPVPADAMDPGKNFDLPGWLRLHTIEKSQAPLDSVVSELKSQGITSIGATGYCYGGRFVFNLAFQNAISVAVCSHPSFLKAPDDLKKYKETSKEPLLINTCTVDQQFPHSAQEKADEIFAPFEYGYRRVYWEGCTHGFAVRGDMNDPKVKAGKESSFKAAVEWFQTNL
ncbi:alpha/beta-hydrolase [Cyathus striatus]|nr:alpha/beta-hydrolase [Cyathus striatus]